MLNSTSETGNYFYHVSGSKNSPCESWNNGWMDKHLANNLRETIQPFF